MSSAKITLICKDIEKLLLKQIVVNEADVLQTKLAHADVQANLKGGGPINTETVNHPLILGLAAHFDI